MNAVYAELLAGLELSALGHFARHSASGFMIANVLHVLGAALVVGAIGVFDTALIARRFADAARIGRFAIPLAAAGLCIQIPTGLILLAAEATKLGINPAFYAKMLFILVGFINVAVFHALFGRNLWKGVLSPSARMTAFVSLGAWVLTLIAGRVIAYL